MPKHVGWYLTNNKDFERTYKAGEPFDAERIKRLQADGYTVEPVYTLTDDEKLALQLSGAR